MSTPDPSTVDWVPIWNAGQAATGAPSTRVYRSTGQSIPTTAWTAITFDSVRYDVGGHWSAGQPTRLTCKTAGTYLVWSSFAFGAVSGGSNRLTAVWLNGIKFAGIGNSTGALVGAGQPFITNTALLQLIPGDYVELQAYQDSAGAVANIPGGDYGCDFAMALLGGVPGPPGVGVPNPIVEGQFVKGSGGAAIWSPVTQMKASASGNQFSAAWTVGGALEFWIDSTRIATLPGVSDNAWHEIGAAGEPAWLNGWGSYGGSFGPVRFRKLPTGEIMFDGLGQAPGVANAAPFTMPAGLRPNRPGTGRALIFHTASSAVTANTETFRVDSNGTVTSSIPANAWASFNGVRYLAEA